MASLRGSPRDSCFTSLIIDVRKTSFSSCAIDFQLFYDPLSKHKIRQEQDQHWQQGANGNFQSSNGEDCTYFFRDS